MKKRVASLSGIVTAMIMVGSRIPDDRIVIGPIRSPLVISTVAAAARRGRH